MRKKRRDAGGHDDEPHPDSIIVESRIIRKMASPEDRFEYQNIQTAFIRRDKSVEALSFMVMGDAADMDCATCQGNTVHDLRFEDGGVRAAEAGDTWECQVCKTRTPYIATRPR